MEVRDFDLMIGRLDRVLSEMLTTGRSHEGLDYPDVQTLTHHAEYLILSGQKILKDLGFDPPAGQDTRNTTDHYTRCSRCGRGFSDMTTLTDPTGSHKYMKACECKGVPPKLIIFDRIL